MCLAILSSGNQCKRAPKSGYCWQHATSTKKTSNSNKSSSAKKSSTKKPSAKKSSTKKPSTKKPSTKKPSTTHKTSSKKTSSSHEFDRLKMPVVNEWKCEGYWQNQDNKSLPFPMKHEQNFVWLEVFKQRLMVIEQHIVEGKVTDISRVGYRGMSISRIDGTMVGNGEYQDNKMTIRWPEGYLEHYIVEYNVLPSQEFYDYVMSFPKTRFTVKLTDF